MGTGLHRYDITFEGAITILEGPMVCLMFARHLKTSVFCGGSDGSEFNGFTNLKKRGRLGRMLPTHPNLWFCHLGMGQIRILFGGG